MDIQNSAVKKTAAFSLKNKYTSGVITACVYLFLIIVLSVCIGLVSEVFGAIGAYILMFIFAVFLLIPVTLGYIYWGTSLIFTDDCEPLLIFKYFSSKKDYFKSLKMSFLLVGNGLLALFLLLIPAIFTELIAGGQLFTLFGAQIPIWTSNLSTLTSILKFAAVFITLLTMLKYYMAPFLMAADEAMDPLEAIHMSKIISIRSKWDFIKLALSFIGYIIACLFIVPIIFIFPYLNVSYNVHCRFAVSRYNKEVDRINEPQIPNFNANITF